VATHNPPPTLAPRGNAGSCPAHILGASLTHAPRRRHWAPLYHYPCGVTGWGCSIFFSFLLTHSRPTSLPLRRILNPESASADKFFGRWLAIV
jgi:hypothetical protein